jgi:hypothetical protein
MYLRFSMFTSRSASLLASVRTFVFFFIISVYDLTLKIQGNHFEQQGFSLMTLNQNELLRITYEADIVHTFVSLHDALRFTR